MIFPGGMNKITSHQLHEKFSDLKMVWRDLPIQTPNQSSLKDDRFRKEDRLRDENGLWEGVRLWGGGQTLGLVQLLEEVRLSALKMGVSLKVMVWGKPQDLCRLQGAGLTSRLGSGSCQGRPQV